MPQSRSRRKRKGSASGPPAKALFWGVPRWQVLLSAAVVLASINGVWAWWTWDRADVAFQRAAAQGHAVLSEVKSFPSEGREHVPQGAPVTYRTDPPTSGPHYPNPTAPGVYAMPQLPGNLVHALEHGNIVIYYDHPTPDIMRMLEDWAHHFTALWAGLVVTPKPGLDQEIILTAWTKMLRLKTFDEAAAAAFIDRFRGRGPENPVR